MRYKLVQNLKTKFCKILLIRFVKLAKRRTRILEIARFYRVNFQFHEFNHIPELNDLADHAN